MLLRDLPQKLQDFAILRMVEDKHPIKKIHKDIRVGGMFYFYETPECYEWEQLFYHHNLEPMYTKYPELKD